MHIEGPSTMFGSVLNYVTLRLLGEGSDSEDGAIQLAQNWILDHGGATFTTSWGKFWLSVRRLCIVFFSVICFGLVTSVLVSNPERSSDVSTFLRFLVYLTGLVTIHCFQNYGYFHTASHFIQVCFPLKYLFAFSFGLYLVI